MKRATRKHVIGSYGVAPIVIVDLLSLVALACGNTLGPTFHDRQAMPAAGLVYIYRPSHFVGGGIAFQVTDGPTQLGFVFAGSYIPYRAMPGKHVFRVGNADVDVTIDVTAAQTYFLEYHTSFGMVSLVVVPPDEGRRGIKGCSLLPGGYDGSDHFVSDDSATGNTSSERGIVDRKRVVAHEAHRHSRAGCTTGTTTTLPPVPGWLSDDVGGVSASDHEAGGQEHTCARVQRDLQEEAGRTDVDAQPTPDIRARNVLDSPTLASGHVLNDDAASQCRPGAFLRLQCNYLTALSCTLVAGIEASEYDLHAIEGGG